MEEEENCSLKTEPAWEHKALSGIDSTPCARCQCILWEAPEKGACQPEGRLAQELNLEMSNSVFDRRRTRFAQGELISGSAAI